MKKLFTVLLSSIVLFSCEGPQGIPGTDGQDGLNGEEAYVFEYSLSFTSPDYVALLELPSDFTLLDSDVMLAYLLWDILDDGTEIWRSVPQSLFITDGILHYNFDFTKYDATLFLDGTIDLDGLGADYTDNWIARIVVVPGLFENGRSVVDISDYHAVIDYYNLSEPSLTTEDYVTRPE